MLEHQQLRRADARLCPSHRFSHAPNRTAAHTATQHSASTHTLPGSRFVGPFILQAAHRGFCSFRGRTRSAQRWQHLLPRQVSLRRLQTKARHAQQTLNHRQRGPATSRIHLHHRAFARATHYAQMPTRTRHSDRHRIATQSNCSPSRSLSLYNRIHSSKATQKTAS